MASDQSTPFSTHPAIFRHPKATIKRNVISYFLGQQRKNISKCRLLQVFLSMLCNNSCWVILHVFLSYGDFFFFSFFKLSFSKKSFRNTIRVSNSLDPDQARHFVGPDLGPNCLQRLSAEDKSRHNRGKELKYK